MRSSFPAELVRLILRQLQEEWGIKFRIALYAIIVRCIFPGYFGGLWWFLTRAPAVPFLSNLDRRAAILSAALAIQCCTIAAMWAWFRRAQAGMVLPWSDIRFSYVIQLLAKDFSPLRWVFFIYSRLGPGGRQARRMSPWHFRHTFALAQVAITSVGLTKLGGLRDLLGLIAAMVGMDTVHLLFAQTRAAIRPEGLTKVRPALDYRHKPHFAWAAVVQTVACLVSGALVSKGYDWADCILLCLPITSIATVLLYLVYEGTPVYLNDSLPVQQRGPQVKFCETCERTVLSPVRDDARRIGEREEYVHHRTVAGLQKSAEAGCRICATAWEWRFRLPQDFLSTFKYWLPATTYNPVGPSIRYKEDPSGMRRCEFEIRKRQGRHERLLKFTRFRANSS